MNWDIHLTSQAEKDVKRLRENAAKALQAIYQLQDDPKRGHTLGGGLKGIRSLEFNLPGGAYRAAYAILPQNKVCLIFIVGPHEGFYEKATRRVKALRRAGIIP